MVAGERIPAGAPAIAIADGDTVTPLKASSQHHKLKLDGIDAPEKGQAFGDRSKQSVSDLAFCRDAAAECHKIDRYGREV